MWYNRPVQYLRKSFTQSGMGVLLMAKKPDNTIEVAQMDANGSIKITGGAGGDATAANQTTQIAEATTTNSLLTTISANIPAAGNEKSSSFTCPVTAAAIGSGASRSVTIYLLSTAAASAEVIINPGGGGTAIFLEAGYSMQIEVTNLTNIQVRQAGGEGDILYYKYI
jgi:hypothetical protein